jgi:hypothetical protein
VCVCVCGVCVWVFVCVCECVCVFVCVSLWTFLNCKNTQKNIYFHFLLFEQECKSSDIWSCLLGLFRILENKMLESYNLKVWKREKNTFSEWKVRIETKDSSIFFSMIFVFHFKVTVTLDLKYTNLLNIFYEIFYFLTFIYFRTLYFWLHFSRIKWSVFWRNMRCRISEKIKEYFLSVRVYVRIIAMKYYANRQFDVFQKDQKKYSQISAIIFCLFAQIELKKLKLQF